MAGMDMGSRGGERAVKEGKIGTEGKEESGKEKQRGSVVVGVRVRNLVAPKLRLKLVSSTLVLTITGL